MVITYRRTGGLFMLLTLAAAGLAATVVTVAVAGILLIVAAAVAAAALFGRAVLPRRWGHRTIPAVTRWPQETIDATVVRRHRLLRDTAVIGVTPATQPTEK